MIQLHLGIILFLVIIASTILTGLLRRYALKKKLIDHPNARSSHEVPTPRGGGAAIVITCLAGLFLLPYLYQPTDEVLYALLVGGLLVGGIGFWDDHGHIRARWRVLVQAIAAAGSFAIVFGVPELQNGPSALFWGCLIFIAAILVIVYLINIYNFMDGIDGIAAAEAITVGVATGILFYFYNNEFGVITAIGLVASAASLGFLVWNWPPAKIFMGDCGSGFLGYIFGFMIAICGMYLLYTKSESELIMYLTLPFLLGVFIVDSTVTLLRRILRWEKFWLPHRMHAYQHSSRRWGHKKVTVAVASINLFFLAPCAWAAYHWAPAGIFIMPAAWMILAIAALALSAGKPEAAKG
ncbi:MAG: glycosyltransferase family 4 protein [Planctomycetes bacterium]|nr:glycosyltransferase family 4 protein [Planctomycetota bacterium]